MEQATGQQPYHVSVLSHGPFGITALASSTMPSAAYGTVCKLPSTSPTQNQAHTAASVRPQPSDSPPETMPLSMLTTSGRTSRCVWDRWSFISSIQTVCRSSVPLRRSCGTPHLTSVRTPRTRTQLTFAVKKVLPEILISWARHCDPAVLVRAESRCLAVWRAAAPSVAAERTGLRRTFVNWRSFLISCTFHSFLSNGNNHEKYLSSIRFARQRATGPWSIRIRSRYTRVRPDRFGELASAFVRQDKKQTDPAHRFGH